MVYQLQCNNLVFFQYCHWQITLNFHSLADRGGGGGNFFRQENLLRKNVLGICDHICINDVFAGFYFYIKLY